MTVKLRLTGDPDDLALDAIGQVLDLATDRRTYPQRGGSGVRCDAEVRPPARTIRVQQEPRAHDGDRKKLDTHDKSK